MEIESKKPERCGLLCKFLRGISLGQYHPKLYTEGEDSSSSAIGGVITLICVIFLSTYAIIVLVGVFQKDNYFIDKQAR